MLEIYTLINNITDYKKRNDILKLLMIHYGIENNEMNMKIIEEADKALKNDYENVSYLLNTNLDKYLVSPLASSSSNRSITLSISSIIDNFCKFSMFL